MGFGRLSMLMETGMPIRVSSAVDLLLLSKRMDKTGVSLLSRTECKCSPTGQRPAAWRMAEVVGVHIDGRCDVKYTDAATDAHTGEEKTIPLDQQASLMRGFR